MAGAANDRLDAEVAVIGVGTVGSMLMWQLARRGVHAIGFERHAPGHDRGAVGGETRLFRMAYAEGAQYAELLRQALGCWRDLESESATALLVQCGGLAIGDLQGDYIGGLLANARTAGVPVEVFDRRAAHDRYPQHLLRDGEVAVLDRQAGFLRCEAAVIAAAATAEQHGATVLRHTGVDEVLERGDHVEIRAGKAAWRVRDAVLCAGSWTARLLPAPWRAHLQARRVPLSWFAARHPEEFTPRRFPIFIRRTDAVEIYGAPSVDGVSVKVASAVGSSPVDDPDQVERRHGRAEISVMSQAVGELLSGLHPHPVRTDSFTDLYSSDGTPLVGRTTTGGRLLVAAAFSGRGFKYAPALAAVVADALVAHTEVPLDFMSPSRLS
ncbi:MAG TPA: N-methyl-L-tryptophan oxidase [Pseudonocardia sp.]|uniref:N-methyl-L-tryptophan oxidase n=1 Tax=Pseudonocardia sp. TaxID=60912 RepID=UPI002C8B4AA6|nr:N-methyl-L-tryptophan oxidase [Pseudonocardia sp.]HTF49899.1 N-methyl-L-tryptophan oxidase [Pseudonocardia sp.]